MLLQSVLKFARYHYGNVGWVALDADTDEAYWFRHKPEYDEEECMWLDDSLKTMPDDVKLVCNQAKTPLLFSEAIYKL